MSKTIQEMADEYVGHPKEISEDSCITAKRESFKQGANAVLEEIENVIEADRILGHPFPSLAMRYNQIISVIEQLKK